MFGELVFMTIRDSEAFEKSSSLFQGFLRFIDSPMCKSNEDIDLWSGNVQRQPWKFEPLKSGLHLVKINLSGSDITRWCTISTSGSTRLPINNERIDQMDWWAFLNMLKTTLQRLVIKLMNTCYEKFIWNNSYLYCGCRWKWRVIIAVNFPI